MQNTNDLGTTNVAEYSLREGCRGLHSVRLPLWGAVKMIKLLYLKNQFSSGEFFTLLVFRESGMPRGKNHLAVRMHVKFAKFN